MLITVEVKGSVSLVVAENTHDKGSDEINLQLKKIENGTKIYEGSWIVHDTTGQMPYRTYITVMGNLGKTASDMVEWLDPTVTHKASQITAGTFGSGDYVFPGKLNVTGELNVSGNLTIGGGLTISGQSGCRVYRLGSQQTFTSDQTTKVEFNGENFDNKDEFDSSTNYRFTAKESGKYLVTAHLLTTSCVDTGVIIMYLKKNGVIYSRREQRCSGTDGHSLVFIDWVPVNAGEYLELFLYNGLGSDFNIYEGEGRSYMSIQKTQ